MWACCCNEIVERTVRVCREEEEEEEEEEEMENRARIRRDGDVKGHCEREIDEGIRKKITHTHTHTPTHM